MTPDLLRKWLKLRPAGAVRVELASETAIGHTQVAEWSREEIEQADPAAGGIDYAETILTTCQEHADSEGTPLKFQIRWMGTHSRPLKLTTHRAVSAFETPAPEGPVTQDQIVRELLAHLGAKEKLLNAAFATITNAQERTLAILTAQLEAYARREIERHDPPPAVDSPEQREESIQRTEALRALTLKLPDVLDLGIAALAQRFLPPGNPVASGPNGGTP